MDNYEYNKAIHTWRQGADEVVQDAKANGSPWIPADSILRPNNLSLWYNLRRISPTLGETPVEYEQLMQEQMKRVNRASGGK